MPRSFTLEDYKHAVDDPRHKTAKEGWEYLVRYGASESEVFEVVKRAVSSDLDCLLSAYQRTRVAPRKVRGLGRQLHKNAELLESVIVQYPSLLPARAENLLSRVKGPVEGERPMVRPPYDVLSEIRLPTHRLPAVLKAVSAKLAECYAKSSGIRDASVVKRRVPAGNLGAGLDMLHLFGKVAADFYKRGSIERFNPPSAEFPEAPVAEKRQAWTCALLNLACELAGCNPTYDSTNLRKMEEERSLKKAVSKP